MDIKEYALLNSIPIIQDEGLNYLLDFIEQNQVKTVLEIGAAIGYSAMHIASSNWVTKVISLERDEKLYDLAIKNTHNNPKIEIVLGDALNYPNDRKFDLLFIDGAKAQYLRFFERFAANAHYIICDNMDFHGIVANPELTNNRNTKALVRKIREFRVYVQTLIDYDVSYYPIGDGLLVIHNKKIL